MASKKLFVSLVFSLIICISFLAHIEAQENNKLKLRQSENYEVLFSNHHFCKDQQIFSWCIPSGYNKEMEPWKDKKSRNNTLPYYYDFEFRIFDVQEVNDLHQTVKLDMYFFIKWREPRLKINETSPEFKSEASIEGGFVPMSLKYLEHLWVPDIEIYGMNNFKSQKVLKPLSSMKINKDGIFRYSTRVNILVSCYMDYEKYPFDSHDCHFRVGSYDNHDKIVKCSSNNNKIENNHGLIDMQRKLQYVINVKELPPSQRTYRIAGRNWATCGFTLELKRIKTQIIVQVYLTSTSLVIVSWLSFIIHPSSIPGRMGLLVIYFLNYIRY